MGKCTTYQSVSDFSSKTSFQAAMSAGLYLSKLIAILHYLIHQPNKFLADKSSDSQQYFLNCANTDKNELKFIQLTFTDKLSKCCRCQLAVTRLSATL